MRKGVLFGALSALGLSLLAFWPNYLSKPAASVDRYTHLHAAAGLAWVLLLVAQSWLLGVGRRAAHRALGLSSFVAAPAFVASGVLLAHHRFSRMPPETFVQEAYTLYLPLSAMVLFAASYVLAIVFRGRPALHGRFMACTALLLVDPVLGRVLAFYVMTLPSFSLYQIVTFGLETALVLAMLRSLPRSVAGDRAFQIFAGAYVVVLALWFFAPRSAAWLAFAGWFRRLPLT